MVGLPPSGLLIVAPYPYNRAPFAITTCATQVFGGTYTGPPPEADAAIAAANAAVSSVLPSHFAPCAITFTATLLIAAGAIAS